MLRIASMPTVCASVPMHAPATRTFARCVRKRSASISSIVMACARSRRRLDRLDVDAVRRAGVDDEKRKPVGDAPPVDDLHVAKTHLDGELARRFVGRFAPLDGKRERHLHFAVVHRVAVRLDEPAGHAVTGSPRSARLERVDVIGGAFEDAVESASAVGRTLHVGEQSRRRWRPSSPSRRRVRAAPRSRPARRRRAARSCRRAATRFRRRNGARCS